MPQLSPSDRENTYFLRYPNVELGDPNTKAANTRPNVSCDGIPPGNSNRVRNQLSFIVANVSISIQLSAPLTPRTQL